MKSRSSLYFVLFILFSLAGIAFVYFSSQPSSPQQVVDKIASNLAEELQSVDEAAQHILTQLEKDPAHPLTAHERFNFYIYGQGRLLAWSDNNFVPSFASVADTFRLKLLKSGSSDYLAKRWKISEQKFLVAIIPLYRKFNITNDYLNVEWNKRVFPSGNISILDANASIGVPVCLQEQCPFKISFVQQELPMHQQTKTLAVILIAVSIVLFLLCVNVLLSRLRYHDLVFLLWYIVLYGIRLAMTKLAFPFAFIQNELFNPQVFASSNLNASLGDLILNEIFLFILCLYLFRNLFQFKVIKWLQQNRILSWVLSVFSGVAVLFAMIFPFVVIQTLYNNSSIILDISQSLRFDGLRIMAMVAFLLAGVCSFLFSHTFIRLLIGDGNKVRILFSFLAAILIFVLINEYTQQPYLSSVIVAGGYLLAVYVLKLYSSLTRLSFTTFTYLFVTVFCYSLNGAYAIQYFSRNEKIENQFRFANNFLIDRDYFGEYLLRELSLKISRDAFIQSRVASPFFTKDAVRQKIRQVFLPSYFNKYDVEIYIFNAAGESVDHRTDVSFTNLIAIYNQDAFRTEYNDVYFVGSPAGDVTQKYLVVVPMTKMKAISGHVVVELSLKKIIPENVYPELLVDNRFQQFYRSQEISYAVFAGGKIVYSAGSVNYERIFNKDWLGNPKLYTTSISAANYDHIALEDDNGRVAVVSSQRTRITYILANFSFLLVLGLTAILLFILVQGMINYFQGDKLYFSARIQLFLNVAFFLPLIIVSAVTLSVTNRSSQNQINDEYLNKAKKFSDQIAVQLYEYLAGKDLTAVTFENQLTDLAKLTNLDANVYNAQGILISTSQPLIFENSLISNFINSDALQKIRRGDNLFIETEKVGALEYYIAYAALKASSSGKLIGILGIPFFQSGYSLEKAQINILSNILNIFALIFIVLVVLSYFVSQWLTFPLKFITQSLRRTSLTKVNQPLVWRSDDEIGLMVKEYNQMLFKLSESKAELEQTQRERAWREIAQQVAHEIKNPLTPMKLTLQQLERALQAGTHSEEKTAKVIASMLTQVNTLNDIASSFSAFAKMPEPVIRRLELVSLLRRVVDLHSHSGDLNFETTIKEVYVDGDEQLLARTFSNIILNAFQAGKPGEPLHVYVKLEKINGVALMSFRDTGKGIEPNVAERIFVPHFTTKKSGSGLGLAIAKQAIEQMKGRIWFETESGKGTTFYIELPV